MVTYCDGQRRWGNARRGRAERCADACAAAEERIRRLRVSEKSGGGRSRRFREIGTPKCESETGAHTICVGRFFTFVSAVPIHHFQRVSFVARVTTTLRSALR
jgi:hypothetical protein